MKKQVLSILTTLVVVFFLSVHSFGQTITLAIAMPIPAGSTDCSYNGIQFTRTGASGGRNIFTGNMPNGSGGFESATIQYNNSRWELRFTADLALGYYIVNTSSPNPPLLLPWTDDLLLNCGTLSIGSIVLPVELINFDATIDGGQNHLTWRTASESQNKGFDIERSADGVRFDKIGFVAGKGTTNQVQNYRFEDNTTFSSPLERSGEVVYYRLKQLDFDGRFEYSKIIAIDSKGENVASVFPNPSTGLFTIAGVENMEDETFTLINSIGQTLSINVQNDGQIDMSAFPSGVYYLRVASNGQVMKLVKE